MFKALAGFIQSKRSDFPIFFLSREEQRRIVAAIRKAEMKTSGEIRVHVQSKAMADILAQGKEVFEKLGMAKTERRNGVLIFVTTRDRRFAVLADRGIHQKLKRDFLDGIAKKMEDHFLRNHFADGIVEAVEAVGEHLKNHFPLELNDANELPDVISYGG
jgi:uncharacterized membrane protein